MKTLKCTVCGKEITVSDSEYNEIIKSGQEISCSEECGEIAYNEYEQVNNY